MGAAERAFRTHREDVYRFLLRKTRDHHDAEELTQCVFADAAESLRDDALPSSTLAWLYTVAQRRFIDYIRRRATARSAVRLLPLTSAGPSDVPREHEVIDALRQSVHRLPDEQRIVLVMKLLEGESFAEIADRVGTTESACRMRFSRALRSIKSSLLEKGIDTHYWR